MAFDTPPGLFDELIAGLKNLHHLRLLRVLNSPFKGADSQAADPSLGRPLAEIQNLATYIMDMARPDVAPRNNSSVVAFGPGETLSGNSSKALHCFLKTSAVDSAGDMRVQAVSMKSRSIGYEEPDSSSLRIGCQASGFLRFED